MISLGNFQLRLLFTKSDKFKLKVLTVFFHSLTFILILFNANMNSKQFFNFLNCLAMKALNLTKKKLLFQIFFTNYNILNRKYKTTKTKS